jgi:transcriptional regulator with XRE-family HTH domain
MQMTTIQEPDPVEWGPLVFEIRQLRLYAREAGLTQAELAHLAGISPRLLRSYEACRALPHSVQSLLCLAFALKVPFEWLIAPRLLDEVRATVESRRAILAARARAQAPSHDR